MKKYFKPIALLFGLSFFVSTAHAQILMDFSLQQVPDGVLIEWGRAGGFEMGDNFELTRKDLATQVEVDLTIISSQGPLVEEYSYTDVGPLESGVEYLYSILWTSASGEIIQGDVITLLEDPFFVTGTLALDEDGECDVDAGESTYSGQIVTATGTSGTLFTTTDSDGFYFFALPNFETFEVQANVPSPYLSSCFPSQTVTAAPGETETLDFPFEAAFDCPYLTVDLGAVAIFRCFDVNYYVNYCNQGSMTAEDATVEVDFDDFLTVNSSSLPWASVSGNTYTFDVGDVEPGECGAILVNVNVSCDATLGQTHCSEAHIFPDSLCVPPSALWDQSSLVLTGECVGDEIVFTITNVGTQAMTEALDYLVVEDNVMLMQGQVGPLGPGESEEKIWLPEGATVRMEVDQSANHPGESNPSVTIEGCGGTPISTGFVLMFPENDGDPFVSIDCRENQGSFDPNDKQAFPRGYDDEHFIEANQDIEYLVRFQNTGTAPAINVRIEDVIDPSLNLLSLRPGASSHPYTFELAEDGTVNFVFENINLPDSTSNEPASHGFVKFRIDQQPDVALGTVITNEAAIYFDFNDPIITNEVFHTIGEHFITVSSVNTVLENVTVNVFPNPFLESATVTVDGMEGQKLSFRLFDLAGKMFSENTFENQMQLDGNGLPSGVYFFEISNQHGVVSTGKLVR